MTVAGTLLYRLVDRYETVGRQVHLTGLQALVRALVDSRRIDTANGRATATYVTGYEGSPLAGFDLELARQHRLLTAHRIRHQPAVNEELAATTVAGTQLARTGGPLNCDGVTGVWYGKAPGLDRAADAVRHANLVGSDPSGGAVALPRSGRTASAAASRCTSGTATPPTSWNGRTLKND